MLVDNEKWNNLPDNWLKIGPFFRLLLNVPSVRFNHRRSHSGLNWQTPAGYAAQLIERPTGVFPAASRVASPVGATPLPPTPHAY